MNVQHEWKYTIVCSCFELFYDLWHYGKKVLFEGNKALQSKRYFFSVRYLLSITKKRKKKKTVDSINASVQLIIRKEYVRSQPVDTWKSLWQLSALFEEKSTFWPIVVTTEHVVTIPILLSQQIIRVIFNVLLSIVF